MFTFIDSNNHVRLGVVVLALAVGVRIPGSTASIPGTTAARVRGRLGSRLGRLCGSSLCSSGSRCSGTNRGCGLGRLVDRAGHCGGGDSGRLGGLGQLPDNVEQVLGRDRVGSRIKMALGIGQVTNSEFRLVVKDHQLKGSLIGETLEALAVEGKRAIFAVIADTNNLGVDRLVGVDTVVYLDPLAAGRVFGDDGAELEGVHQGNVVSPVEGLVVATSEGVCCRVIVDEGRRGNGSGRVAFGVGWFCDRGGDGSDVGGEVEEGSGAGVLCVPDDGCRAVSGG